MGIKKNTSNDEQNSLVQIPMDPIEQDQELEQVVLYECNYCDSNFKQLKALKKHTAKHVRKNDPLKNNKAD